MPLIQLNIFECTSSNFITVSNYITIPLCNHVYMGLVLKNFLYYSEMHTIYAFVTELPLFFRCYLFFFFLISQFHPLLKRKVIKAKH